MKSMVLEFLDGISHVVSDSFLFLWMERKYQNKFEKYINFLVINIEQENNTENYTVTFFGNHSIGQISTLTNGYVR